MVPKRVPLAVAGLVLAAMPAAGQRLAPAEFARSIVTAAVQVPGAGLEYRVEPVAGVTIVGPSSGLTAAGGLVVSLRTDRPFAAGRQQLAVVRVGGRSVPVIVDVALSRGLSMSVPARLDLRPGVRDSVVGVVRNRGNTPERVQVAARAGPGIRVAGARALELAAGDTARVAIPVTAERSATGGQIVVEARSGDVSARSVVAVAMAPASAAGLPVTVQGIAGAEGACLSVRAEAGWGDSVRVRLSVGPRPPAGLSQVFWAPEPRALSVTGPRWGLAVGEVRATGTPVQPSVSGTGLQARWRGAGGWALSAAVARPAARKDFAATGLDAVLRAERPFGGARLVAGAASVAGAWGDRIAVFTVGARSGAAQGAAWSGDVGVAAADGAATPVGRLAGRVAGPYLRGEWEIERSGAARRTTLAVLERVAGGIDAGGRAVSAFAYGSAAREGAGGETIGSSESASLGVRLQGGGARLELRGGLQGSDRGVLAEPWSAAVGGSAVRFTVGRTLTLGLGYDHAWSAAGEQSYARASVDWLSRRGSVGLQAERGSPVSPFWLPPSWHVRLGGQWRGDVWSAAVSAGIEEGAGGWRPSGVGEAGWRARSDTELLVGARRFAWSERPLELFVGVRQRVGLRVAARQQEMRGKFGELVVRIAFGSVPAGAVESVARGAVRLRLPDGGVVEAAVVDGRVVFSALAPGRYEIEHVAPVDATRKVETASAVVQVVSGRSIEVVVAAAYLPRAMTIVQLDAGGATAPGPPRPARVRGGGSCGALVPAPEVEAAITRQVVVPGMSEVEVACVLGAAAVRRAVGEWVYLFYGCPRRCAYGDVVFLRSGRVVTAYLRSPARRFEGPAPATALARSVGR